ncbi:hypothetical protein [Bacillus amyloliquefaciens]|uniref:hypothetical protein n=1 Tax=Bacillus amyloliquefaciens TaxID=1390 RepID=UPI001CD450B4|nr:hypothetical protein [Bacillus amyloliquefaciens]
MIAAEQVTFSVHARKRLRERCNITNLHVARNWIAQKLQHAKYLGVSVDANGNEARMYGGKGVVIHLDLNDNFVITVYTPDNRFAQKFITEAYETMKQGVETAVKNNENYAVELYEEIEYLRAEYKRSHSAAKRMAYQARINAVQMRIDELPDESFELKRKLTKAAKGVASYV